MYLLVVSLDANFKLKLKARDFDNIDLTQGWSYFVADEKYGEFISRYGDQEEVRSQTFRPHGVLMLVYQYV